MGKVNTYVNEPLQILIQAGQVFLALIILCNQSLFPLKKLLARLFQFLPLRMFMIDASNHKLMGVRISVFWEKSEELFDRY